MSLTNAHPLMQYVYIQIYKRDACRFCQALMPNIIMLQDMLEKGLSRSILKHAIKINELSEGRVPQIWIVLQLPLSSTQSWKFQYTLPDRSAVTLMSVYLFFSTIVFPNKYIKAKFSDKDRQSVEEHFDAKLKRHYPYDFITRESIEELDIDLHNQFSDHDIYNDYSGIGPIPVQKPSNTPKAQRIKWTTFDIDMWFYYLNHHHTRHELFKHLSSEVKSALVMEEQR